MPNHTSLVSLFGDIADAIRGKTGGSSQIAADDFPTAIAGITTLRVGAKTITTGSSGIAGINFTDLPAEPVYFFCFGTPSISSGMAGATSYRYITAVWFDGEHVYSHRLYRGNNSTYLYFDTDTVTKTYSNGTMNLHRGSDTNHRFYSSLIYTLIYFY
ncbi:MAG: hypothetical protein IJI40_02035 [Firmicutes bacterium]|nr:hypothetical protein [Bacillota bacterium]MBQ6607338.1 hypothetical protein [Bacillota bacterium]MBR0179256.1 hypothetical protein [Bacillota bacterium]